MRMEGGSAFLQHAGTFGGQWIERIRLRWRFTFSDRQSPIEAAKDHADCPRNQILTYICTLFYVVGIVRIKISFVLRIEIFIFIYDYRVFEQSSVFGAYPIDFERNLINFRTNRGQLILDLRAVECSLPGANSLGKQERTRSLVDGVESAL